MKVIIVSERPSLSRAIAPTARAHWPTADITFVHAVPYGNIKFVYPRGLRMQDYPQVSEPVHGLVSWSRWACAPVILDAEGLLTEVPMGEEHITEADLIVYACDPDHTGAVAFDVLMAVVFGDDRALQCPALRLWSLDEPSVKKAFTEMKPFGEACARSLEYGLVKRYFEWNWNVNAFAVLGDAVRRAGVPAEAPPLSKYSLQVLFAMRTTASVGEGKLISLMTRWPGTGRYPYPKNQAPFLGSCASQSQILENLVIAGLLDRRPTVLSGPVGLHEGSPTVLVLSDRGRAVLALLHPDCEDPDLPFRLDAWCDQGSAAKSAIDRYIKTFFGKQLRFAGTART